MSWIYKRFAITVAITSVVAIIGSISPAQAFKLFSDRNQWEAALGAPTETLDFGESKLISPTSEPTVFPNGVSISASKFGNGSQRISAGGTTVGAVRLAGSPDGSVRGTISVKLPSPVNALGYDISVGPVNGITHTTFISETGSTITPVAPSTPRGFTGIISQPGDPLIAGFTISNGSAGTGFFNASNITIASVPEASSILGLLVAVGTFAARTVFLQRQKQQKSRMYIN